MGTSPIEPALPPFERRLLDRLLGFPDTNRLWVAYSGGVDSHVLLHALAALRHRLIPSIVAVHVNHGLQASADKWERHCATVCRDLDVPLESRRISLRIEAGQSAEEVAREGRYGLFRSLVQPGDIVLTAHHQSDQAETVLIQLIRGAGPSGLAAMPSIAPFGDAWLGRPLLEFARTEIDRYAESRELAWIEDPSNEAVDMDRNFLRREVIPRLTARWPSVSATLSRSARHCAEAQGLIDEMARVDLHKLQDPGNGSVSVNGVQALAPPRGRAVLRAWIRQAGRRLPDTVHLDRIMREMLTAREDRNPVVGWGGTQIRRYRGRLYVMVPPNEPEASWSSAWDGEADLLLPAGRGVLRAERGAGGIARAIWIPARKRVSFRGSEERLRPAGRGVSVSFKNFFQEQGIPPWERAAIPLVYLDDRLAAVADLCVCEGFGEPEGTEGMRIAWKR